MHDIAIARLEAEVEILVAALTKHRRKEYVWERRDAWSNQQHRLELAIQDTLRLIDTLREHADRTEVEQILEARLTRLDDAPSAALSPRQVAHLATIVESRGSVVH